MRRSMRGIMGLGCAALGCGGVAVCAAEVIVDQPYDNQGHGFKSQVYPDFPSFDTFNFDDFAPPRAYRLTTATCPGIEVGNPEWNIAVIAEVWTAMPDRGGILVMEADGYEDSEGTLHHDFHAQRLEAGSYWFSSYIVRNFGVGGQRFWVTTTPVTGSESWWWNPGDGYGYGTASIPGSVVSGVPRNMAFRLEGEPVGPTLSVDGSCPGGGAISVMWEGATAGGRVGLLYSRSEGTFTLPPGSPCAGMVIDLDRGGLRLVFSGSAGQNGLRRITGEAPGAACGHYLQLVDRATCETSNVARIE